MVAVPARPASLHVVRWIAPVVLAVGAWIALLWSLRPRWNYCIDGVDAAHSHCDSGVFSLGAQLATVGLLGLSVVYIVLVLAVRGALRRRVLVIALVVVAAACLGGLVLNDAQLQEVPVTIID